MSLIAHYKLDGNIADTTGNSSAFLYNQIGYYTGKIGLCGYFRGNGTGDSVQIAKYGIFKSNISFSWWQYDQVVDDKIPISIGSYNIQGIYWHRTLGITAKTTNGADHEPILMKPVDAGNASTWKHYVFTYNKLTKTATTYYNGTLFAETVLQGEIIPTDSSNPISLGAYIASPGTYGAEVSIDDFKLFDHVLSPKEVKELYKCKLLHYTFDQFEEYTENVFKTVQGLDVVSEKFGTAYPFFNGEAGLDSWFKANTGKTVTMSFEGRKSGSGTGYPVMYMFVNDWSWAATVSINEYEYKRGHFTFTIPDTTGKVVYGPQIYHMSAGSTGMSYAKNLQLELKDHVTPFVNGVRASVITDNSGYGNNGLIDITGPRWASPGIIGSGCLFFNGLSATEAITSMLSSTTLISLTNCSISFWKQNTAVAGWLPFTGQTTGYYLMATSNGTGAFYHANAGTPTIYRDGVIATTPATDTGVWHHYVVTGVNFSTWTALKFSGYDAGWAVEGFIDDIQIYNSVLSQGDILDLYQSRAYMDNTGKLSSRNLLEIGRTYKPSLIDYSTWIVDKTGSQVGFNQNGDGNIIIIKKNPIGVEDIVWGAMNNDVANDADGGWNGTFIPIDKTKKYRVTCWVRGENVNNFIAGTGGSIYIGFNSSSDGVSVGAHEVIIQNPNGYYGPAGNPYFMSNSTPGELNTWLLVVGFIQPYGVSTPSNEGRIYRSDGTIFLPSINEYAWASTAAYIRHRAYLYYSTNPDTYQYFYRPRIDLCDGTEPTIPELLACRENPNLIDSLLPSNSLNWVLTNVTKDTQGGIYKTGGAAAWDAQAYTNTGYTGGAYLRFKVAADRATGGGWMFGINSDPATDANYPSIDYCWYNYPGYAEVYQSGVSTWQDVGNPMQVGDVFEIYYDNANIYYYRNGALKLTTVTTANRTFYVDSSFVGIYTSAQVTDIYFGPKRILTGLKSTGTYITPEISEIGPSDNLLAYYTLDGATSTRIQDDTGNGYVISLNNNPTYTDFRNKRAITLDGISQYGITSLPQSRLGQEFTISAWVYPTAENNYRGLLGDHGGTYAGMGFLQYSGTNRYCLWGNGAAWQGTTLFNIPLNTWTHIVWNLKAGASGWHKVYRNNSLIVNDAVSTAFIPYGNILFGRSYNSADRYWQGSAADIRIYTKSLNIKEIESLYNLKPTNVYIEDNGVINTALFIEG